MCCVRVTDRRVPSVCWLCAVTAAPSQVHPGLFGTHDLMNLPQFKKAKEDAFSHAKRALKEEAKDEEKLKTEALQIMNDVLQLKLITVFVAVIDAVSKHPRPHRMPSTRRARGCAADDPRGA
jgi:hypothetical protein